jgi:hypothetical protein
MAHIWAKPEQFPSIMPYIFNLFPHNGAIMALFPYKF